MGRGITILKYPSECLPENARAGDDPILNKNSGTLQTACGRNRGSNLPAMILERCGQSVRPCVRGRLCAVPATVAAQEQGALSGVVMDSLGARVPGAAVTLNGDGAKTADTKSDAEGAFSFRNLAPGRYQVTATAQGFQPRTSEPVYAGPGTRASVEVVLEVGPLQQDVVVTAEAGGSPAVTDRRAGHRDRQRDARRPEQARRARSAAPRARRPDRAGGSARRCDLTLPARRQFQLHQGPRGRDAGERHRRRIRFLAARHGRRRSHRGVAPDQ